MGFSVFPVGSCCCRQQPNLCGWPWVLFLVFDIFGRSGNFSAERFRDSALYGADLGDSGGDIFSPRPAWDTRIYGGAGSDASIYGFRSTLWMLMIVIAFQFAFERLYRGRYHLVLVGSLALIAATLIAVGDRLPLSFQRSISFLPIELDALAKHDADSTVVTCRTRIEGLALPKGRGKISDCFIFERIARSRKCFES